VTSPLPVRPRKVEGTWIRHVPDGADLLGRANPPSDGRWQRGAIVPALYLADTTQTATAEWYRSLAEWGLSPQHSVALDPPRPSRRTWPAYQQVGEQLWREGWAGLIAPSAAHPDSLVTCIFASTWPPAGCTPMATSTVEAIPPPPRGMTT